MTPVPARPRAAARADLQRARILDAAQRCFVESGFHAATMAKIAETAGMSAGLIYRYFESKNAIVLAIIERLSAAPFSLLARVDHGEFVLRQPVGPALEALSSYALSLKERLPERRVERLTGHGEPLLIADDAEEVDAEDDIGPGGISA